MCGRVFISESKITAAKAGVDAEQDKPADKNNPPGGELPVIADDIPNKLQYFFWGLVPHWSKTFGGPSNARIETITEKPTFRHLIGKHHAVAVVEGFYEWDRTTKQPHFIYRTDGQPLYMACIWDVWNDPETNIIFKSCAVITKASEGIMTSIHERMPVILNRNEVNIWIDNSLPGNHRLEFIQSVTTPDLSMHPVSRAVNNAKNKNFDPGKPEPPDLTLF